MTGRCPPQAGTHDCCATASSAGRNNQKSAHPRRAASIVQTTTVLGRRHLCERAAHVPDTTTAGPRSLHARRRRTSPVGQMVWVARVHTRAACPYATRGGSDRTVAAARCPRPGWTEDLIARNSSAPRSVPERHRCPASRPPRHRQFLTSSVRRMSSMPAAQPRREPPHRRLPTPPAAHPSRRQRLRDAAQAAPMSTTRARHVTPQPLPTPRPGRTPAGAHRPRAAANPRTPDTPRST